MSVTLFIKSQRHYMAGNVVHSSGHHRSHQGGGLREVEWAGCAQVAEGREKSFLWGNLSPRWTHLSTLSTDRAELTERARSKADMLETGSWHASAT